METLGSGELRHSFIGLFQKKKKTRGMCVGGWVVGVEDMKFKYEKWIWKQSGISRGDQEKSCGICRDLGFGP